MALRRLGAVIAGSLGPVAPRVFLVAEAAVLAAAYAGVLYASTLSGVMR